MADETKETNPRGIRVFVYGTLKSGRSNNRLLEGAERLGVCVIEGHHTLVDLGYYPGLVQRSSGEPSKVVGEVWRLKSKDQLDAIDMLEGHPDYYARAKVQTPWKGAWCYFLPQAYLERVPPVQGYEQTGVQGWRMNEEEVAYVRAGNGF